MKLRQHSKELTSTLVHGSFESALNSFINSRSAISSYECVEIKVEGLEELEGQQYKIPETGFQASQCSVRL